MSLYPPLQFSCNGRFLTSPVRINSCVIKAREREKDNFQQIELQLEYVQYINLAALILPVWSL